MRTLPTRILFFTAALWAALLLYTGARPVLANPYNLGIGIADTDLNAHTWANLIANSNTPTQVAAGDPPAPTDANGWPLSDCNLYVCDGGFVAKMEGTYKLKFTGQATLVWLAPGASPASATRLTMQ